MQLTNMLPTWLKLSDKCVSSHVSVEGFITTRPADWLPLPTRRCSPRYGAA